MKHLHWICVFAAIVMVLAPVLAEIAIVDEGQGRAAIVISEDAPERVTNAAAELSEYLQQSSGAELPVTGDDRYVPVKYPVQIHVGPTEYAAGLDLDLGTMDGDGFVIAFPDEEHIVIAGPTAHGTQFGVYEFLERYVGVRWLLPGPDGTDVPKHSTITIPAEQVRQEPAFMSRHMSGYRGDAQGQWLDHMRRHSRISFHHNLVRLFPPEEYTETHPEFFPIHDGERFLPPSNDTHGWQPCFTAPGIVDEAIKNIVEYFDEHPDATSYSLGVNDSSGHCECEDCRALDSGEENFLGRRDVSDRYFAWANQVVEGVLEKYPDKWFGCLAYSEVAEPPKNINVHPRIVPYMTYDRMKWIQPEVRADGEKITKQWAEATGRLGWYDYIYGTPYCLPRVYFHHRSQYYRWGHEQGVRALYAEAYPNFGEGPKLYVAWKLQWDPYQDVDGLLDEWYARCVGEEAAPYLAKYYAHWEDFWTRRVLDSPWWTDGGQYLRFNDPGYLADVSEDEITLSRQWLETAVEKAKTEKQRARAELLLDAFEYYEASWVAYNASLQAPEVKVENESDALDVLQQAERAVEMAQKRLQMVEERADHPVLQHPIPPTRYPGMRGDGWGAQLLWRIAEYVGDAGSPVHQRLREISKQPENPLSGHASALLALQTGEGELISTNSSFEEGDGRAADGWYLWVKWGVGSMYRSDQVASDGEWSCCCDGMRRGGPNQVVSIEPGNYAAGCRVYIPEGQAVRGTVSLGLTVLNADGQNATSYETAVHPKPGEWTQGTLAVNIPEKVAGETPTKARLIVIVNGFEPDDRVYIDDLETYRLPD